MILRAGGEKRLALLPAERVEKIRKQYCGADADFIGSSFDEGEFRVIDSTEGFGIEDYFALAQSDFIVEERRGDVPHYDNLTAKPEWRKHYLLHQIPWAQTQKYLLGARLGKNPTPGEIADDSRRNETGLRYKVYYCVRFPERIEPKR